MRSGQKILHKILIDYSIKIRDRFVCWLIRRPNLVVGIIAGLTLVSIYGLARIRISTELKDALPKGDPKLKVFNRIDSIFGGTDFIMLILETDNIFTYENLKELEDLTLMLEEIEGVNRVISITNIEEIKGAAGGIEAVKLIPRIPVGEEMLLELKKKILADKDYVGNLVSGDGKSAAVIIQVLHEDEGTVVREVRNLINSVDINGKGYLTGNPVVGEFLVQAVSRDMGRLTPLVIGVVIVILFLSFGDLLGVILPLFTAIIANLWTIGLMGFLDIPLTQISSLLPVILISVGTAYGIHIFARYEEEITIGRTKEEAVMRSLNEVGLSIFLASVTTMIGFFSLYFSPLGLIKEFGFAAGIGVGFALIISTTLIPSILTLSKSRRAKKIKYFSPDRFLIRLSEFVIRESKIALIMAVGLSLLAIAGMIKIRPEMDIMGFVPPQSPPRRAFEFAKEKFGGAEAIVVMVEGDIQDPEVLRSMERFQVELQKVEIVSTSYSIVDILKKTKRALNNGDPAYEILPESNQETAQYLLLLSMDSPEMLESMISFEYDKALITARIGSGTSQEKEKVVRRLEKLLEESFGKDTRVTLTGTSVLTTRMSRLLIVGQLRSLGSALIFVLLLLVTIFRSLPYGVFCGAPIILTVLLIFGVMGWIGIPLDVASAMVASIAVGIGVDYSIHLFNRFREEKRKQRVEAALQIGIKETGKAILYNAVAVGAGFLILVFSSFPPLARFGGLVALAMLISALGAIVVLPSLLKLKKEV